MSSRPPIWTEEELAFDIEVSSCNFRNERLAPTDSWQDHYHQARGKFEALFRQFDDLQLHNLSDDALALAFKYKLGEVLRYLAGPPISDDDLKVLAEVESLAPGVISKDHAAIRKVFGIIEQVIDPFRFPWVAENRRPTEGERSAALLASSVLLAAQRIATERRIDGKTGQETLVKNYLSSMGFQEIQTETINTIVRGPQRNQFCAESQLGERKADIVVRLHDTRLMAIECKVSNSALNSVKRINNDAAVKAGYWLKAFGSSQVVPAAMLSGVFKVLNLQQAQERGLSLFWAHDLDRLGSFIESTK